MLIDCKECEAVVNAKLLCDYESYEDYDEDLPEAGGYKVKYSFLKCPKCEMPFIAWQQDEYGFGWSNPYRIYPPQDKRVNPSFPEPIRNAYQEALTCFKGKAFTATAIMCRKTLEGICSVHGINARNLASKLEELKDKEIIESRLFEWAEELRLSGNDAAHDVNITISHQDAKDIIEFTDALLEYVFTLRDKFDEFTKRKQVSKQRGAKGVKGNEVKR
ncbi:MAG: DUF4145 domain-containing protein [Candidatus Brocadiales bacterium]